jgi:mannose-6-phosphate isomerase-like protein (cupin superfamily)
MRCLLLSGSIHAVAESLFQREEAMPYLIAAVIALSQSLGSSIPAADITQVNIVETTENAILNNVTDTPMRTIDAGGHNIGVALAHRGPSSNVVAGTIHSEVTEIYTVLAGSGTLVTGGRLLNPKEREITPLRMLQSGPGWTGSGMEGAVFREVVEGDIIVIPAGTPHYFSDVADSITYSIVRVDPNQILTLQ